MENAIIYYNRKLERTKRMIEKLKPSLDEELPVNEKTKLLILEAEKRLIEEFIEDLKLLKD